MRVLRSARWLLLIAILALVPASSFAGVFISVGFAPPELPVYEQPPCPEAGLMWTPGFWAYGEDGYYWVPGTWVPAPYEGALWTPPYWGWQENLYVYHPGYWGRHVGYYGGVNYGFGYMGIGFVGGMWRGHDFEYNRAVVRVNETVIHNTYIDRTVVERNTIRNERRVAFAGGRDGIHHEPSPEERMALRESHVAPTSFQQHHIEAARVDRTSYFKANNGRPQNVAVARPLTPEHRANPAGPVNAGEQRGNYNGRPAPVLNGNNAGRVDNRPTPGGRPANPAYQPQGRPLPARPDSQPRYEPQGRPAQDNRPALQTRQTPEPRYQQPQSRPAPENRPMPQSRPEPNPRYEQPQSRPAPSPRYEQPQARPAPSPRYEQPQSRPAPSPRYEQPQSRPAPSPRYEQPQSRPAPSPRFEQPQSRPAPAPRAEQPRPAPQQQHPEQRPHEHR